MPTTPSNTISLRWANEDLLCLPQRALFWPRRDTLIIADAHLGKPATFRSVGIPIPEGSTHADLARLSTLVAAFDAKRLVILGDLLHSRRGREQQTMAAVADWRASLPNLDILLIRGNHDRSAGDPPSDWNLRIADQVHADPADAHIAFAHEPEHVPDAESRHVLCGHLHPAAVLDSPTRTLKAPCFWFRPRRAVLPAFGSFTGTLAIRPCPDDRVLIVGDNQVIDMTARATLHRATEAECAKNIP